jgi:hypothetical protein
MNTIETNRDARAFRPGASTLERLIEDDGPAPIFHFEMPRARRSLCGATGFTRSSTGAVTCERCRELLTTRRRR